MFACGEDHTLKIVWTLYYPVVYENVIVQMFNRFIRLIKLIWANIAPFMQNLKLENLTQIGCRLH